MTVTLASPDIKLEGADELAARAREMVWFVRQVHIFDPVAGRKPTGESIVIPFRVGPFFVRNTGGAFKQIRIVRRGVRYHNLYCISLDDFLDPDVIFVRVINVLPYTDMAEGLSAVFTDPLQAANHRVLIRLSADPSTITSMTFLLDSLCFSSHFSRSSLHGIKFNFDT